jgi:hypothetical protein
MYPVDTIKTRMQALSHPGQRVGGPRLADRPRGKPRLRHAPARRSRRQPQGRSSGMHAQRGAAAARRHLPGADGPLLPPQLHSQGVVGALRAVVKREGVAGLYRGVGAVAWGAGCAPGGAARLPAHPCLLPASSRLGSSLCAGCLSSRPAWATPPHRALGQPGRLRARPPACLRAQQLQRCIHHVALTKRSKPTPTPSPPAPAHQRPAPTPSQAGPRALLCRLRVSQGAAGWQPGGLPAAGHRHFGGHCHAGQRRVHDAC